VSAIKNLPRASARLARPVCHLGISGDENGQASGELANNAPANNAENRFHGLLYRAGTCGGQGAACVLATTKFLFVPRTCGSGIRRRQFVMIAA
jgi:hypothetical protein